MLVGDAWKMETERIYTLCGGSVDRTKAHFLWRWSGRCGCTSSYLAETEFADAHA